MQLNLTDEEARLLALHLTKHIKHVDDELVHTDKRSMQRELALDERRLVSILEKLEDCLASAGTTAQNDVPLPPPVPPPRHARR
jgi:hypothetical protein